MISRRNCLVLRKKGLYIFRIVVFSQKVLEAFFYQFLTIFARLPIISPGKDTENISIAMGKEKNNSISSCSTI